MPVCRVTAFASTALAGLIFTAIATYLASPLRPVAWEAPTAPPQHSGAFALNRKLEALHRTTRCGAVGPESLSASPTGGLAAGYSDGSIRLTSESQDRTITVVRTGGRPLGLAYLSDGSLVVADERRGLLRVAAGGTVESLSTGFDGRPYRYLDGLAASRDGRFIYYTDATAKFGPRQDTWSILEHAGDGRLLRYDLRSHRVEMLLDGLQFANGVALGPEDAFALIAESGAYRVQRLWLTGPRTGSVEIFADNLPGFPDNVTFNGSDRFWVAIHSPRSAILDALAPHPTLRRLLAFLPQQEQNSGPRMSMALAFDLSGKVRANLSATGASAFGPVTEAREFGDRLFFGSDESACPAWLPLADAL